MRRPHPTVLLALALLLTASGCRYETVDGVGTRTADTESALGFLTGNPDRQRGNTKDEDGMTPTLYV